MKNALILTVATLGLGAFSGCAEKKAGSDGSGTIECTQVQVSAQVAGRLLKLLPEEGEAVHKNEVAAQLDPADFELKKAELTAALAQAQAQLDLLKAGSRKEDIQRARDQFREVEAVAKAAAADLTRIRQVFEKGSATAKQLDDAKAAVERSAAAQAAAEQNLNRYLRGSREEEIRLAQAQMDGAAARLAQAVKAIADCTVFIPLDGIVTTRIREPGEYVTPGQPLVTISRLDEVWVAIYLPVTRLAAVKLGQQVAVTVEGADRRFPGIVTFISPEAEFTPRNVQTPEERAKLVYRLKVTLPNPEGVFKPGMPADVYF